MYKSECTILSLLGSGGQGEVFRCTVGGKEYALKWYFPHTATKSQRFAVQELIDRGSPGNSFLWPLKLVFSDLNSGSGESNSLLLNNDGAAGNKRTAGEAQNHSPLSKSKQKIFDRQSASSAGTLNIRFGYLMPIRSSRFRTLIDIMARRVEPSFRILFTTAYNIVDGFLALHTKGLAYRDISLGNVFFDPVNGDIAITDNDNVTVDAPHHARSSKDSGKPDQLGAAADRGICSLSSSSTDPVVLGTPRFMAPEIVIGKALPSRETDLYSLSVLLFYLLCMHHPLEGKREAQTPCLDYEEMVRLYGEDPLFIFDPTHKANEPVPGIHDNAILFWQLYPASIRKLFTQSFTIGLSDPQNGRVAESIWRNALIRLRDSVMYCSDCGCESIYDPEIDAVAGYRRPQPKRKSFSAQSPQLKEFRCWNCAKHTPLPPTLEFSAAGGSAGSSFILLNYDAVIYPHHFGALYDFSKTLGTVVRHPNDPAVWGLKNHSDSAWNVTKPDGMSFIVPPKKSLTIQRGLTLHFPAYGTGHNSAGTIGTLQ